MFNNYNLCTEKQNIEDRDNYFAHSTTLVKTNGKMILVRFIPND